MKFLIFDLKHLILLMIFLSMFPKYVMQYLLEKQKNEYLFVVQESVCLFLPIDFHESVQFLLIHQK